MTIQLKESLKKGLKLSGQILARERWSDSGYSGCELNQFKIPFLELRNAFRKNTHHCKIFRIWNIICNPMLLLDKGKNSL